MGNKKVKMRLLVGILFFSIYILINASRVIVTNDIQFNLVRSILLIGSLMAAVVSFFLAFQSYTRKSSGLGGSLIWIGLLPAFIFGSCQSYFTLFDGPHLESPIPPDAPPEENYSPFGLVTLKDGSTVFVGYDSGDIAVVYKQTQLSENFFKKEIVCKANNSSEAINFKVGNGDKVECTVIHGSTAK